MWCTSTSRIRSSRAKANCEIRRRNFRGMSLTDADVANLVAFLKALTEDYEDT